MTCPSDGAARQRVSTPTGRRVPAKIGWVLAALCAAYLARHFALDPAPLRALRSIGPSEIVALLSLTALYLFVQAFRYLLVLERCAAKRVGLAPWLRIFVVGRFLSLAMPQAGNVYRGLVLRRDFGISYARYFFSMASFAWIDMVVNLLLTLVAVAVASPALRFGEWRALHVLAALLLLSLLAPVATLHLARIAASRARRLGDFAGRAERVLESAISSLLDVRYSGRLVALGVVLFVLASAIFSLCFGVLNHPVGPSRAGLFFLLLRSSVYLSLTPGNLGVLEVGFGALGRMIGVGVGEAILVSAIVRVAGTLCVVVATVACGGLGILRELQRAAPGSQA